MSQSHSVLLFQLSMFGFNEVMNELGRTTPKPTTPNRGVSANQQALKVFKLSSNRPTGDQSACAAPPPTAGGGQSRARTSQNTAAGQCRGAPRWRPPPMGAAGRKEKQCGPAGRRIRTERPLRSGSRPSGAGQSAAAARGPRTLGHGPAPRCCLCVGGRGSGTTTLARRAAGRPEAQGPEAAGGGERDPRAASLPRPPSPTARRPEPCR